MPNYRYTFVGTNDIRFVNAATATDKLRFVQNLNQKRVGAAQLTSSVNQIIDSFRLPVFIGGERVGEEDATIRTYFSASVENKDQMQARVLRHIHTILSTYVDGTSGFKPTPNLELSADTSDVAALKAGIVAILSA